MSSPNDTNQEKEPWLVRKSTIRQLWIGYIVVLVLTLIPNFFVDSHAAFPIADTFGFHAWYGFLTCVAMVLFAKLLGVFLKRGDSYYD